jgi:predicted RNase H-like nuclease (RuvC/YqgF family)
MANDVAHYRRIADRLETERTAALKTIEFQSTTIKNLDASVIEIRRQLDSEKRLNAELGRGIENREKTIETMRCNLDSLKEHTHRLEMQLSRLEGYRDHVREVADSQRAPVTTTITEPSTAPRMQARQAMRDTAHGRVVTANDERRSPEYWFNY